MGRVGPEVKARVKVIAPPEESVCVGDAIDGVPPGPPDTYETVYKPVGAEACVVGTEVPLSEAAPVS